MTTVTTHLLRGAVAGAVGTTTLNAATYADMAVRGRAASSTPEEVVERAAGLVGVALPDDPDKREATKSGTGSLLGVVAGVSAGVALGALRAAGRPSNRTATVGVAWLLAMLAGNGPMTVAGVTDPRSWTASEWLADAVPHAAYALAAAGVLELFDRAD